MTVHHEHIDPFGRQVAQCGAWGTHALSLLWYEVTCRRCVAWYSPDVPHGRGCGTRGGVRKGNAAKAAP